LRAVVFFPHLIVFLAALAATVTGYGFVLLASPLLLLLMAPAEAVPLSIALGWLVISALLTRRSIVSVIDRSLALRLALAGMAAVPLGAALLLSLDARALRVVLGLIIAALALISLRAVVRGAAAGPMVPIRGRIESWLRSSIAGFSAGVLSGSAGLGGSMLVLYLSRRGLDKHRLRATSAATIWFTSSFTLVVYAMAGRFASGLGVTILTLVPALGLGMFVGSRVFHALPERRFRYLSLTFAAVAGLITAANGFLAHV
jgi:uncharacterized protein